MFSSSWLNHNHITYSQPSAKLQVRTRQPRDHEAEEDGPLGEAGPAKLGVEPLGLGEVDGGQAGEPVGAAGEGGQPQREAVDGGRRPQQQRPPGQVQRRQAQNRAEPDGLRVVESARARRGATASVMPTKLFAHPQACGAVRSALVCVPMCYVSVCVCMDYGIVYSLCMGWPARVPLMGVIHICDPRAEEEPEAVESEKCAAQHDG